MTIKSLLLGAAASFTALAVAQAADLPMTKGEAVEYVKVCSTFGPGYFYIPGSDTCLKITGDLRAAYRFYSQSGDGVDKREFKADGYKQGRNFHDTAFNTEERLAFEARTQTDYGLLRSYFQLRAYSRVANFDATKDTSDSSFVVKYAFLQFGGLTAGLAHSYFGFYDYEYANTVFASYFGDTTVANLIAYTADFNNGFTATLSIEDGRDHRKNAFAGNLQGGQQFPDIVGQFRLKQDWVRSPCKAPCTSIAPANPPSTRRPTSPFPPAAPATLLAATNGAMRLAVPCSSTSPPSTRATSWSKDNMPTARSTISASAPPS